MVIGVIGVIVTITIATIVFKKNKKWKTLDYIVLSDVHLLSSSASDVKDLVVKFKGRELSAPRDHVEMRRRLGICCEPGS